jgi:RNA polymerase sigma-70 factor (ECF subfamily)
MNPDPKTVSDEELARQSQAGSLDAFEELVTRFEGRIFGFAVNQCRHAGDASEVAQETFVRAYQAISQYDSRRPFAPWLFAIARRKCLDSMRAALRHSDETMPELTDLDDPAELLAREEQRRDLWQLARRRLPQAQFQATWLRYVEDMKVADIARVLGTTETHVKVLLFRARNTLAAELQDERQPRPAPERHSIKLNSAPLAGPIPPLGLSMLWKGDFR